jgi:hypothetical protein
MLLFVPSSTNITTINEWTALGSYVSMLILWPLRERELKAIVPDKPGAHHFPYSGNLQFALEVLSDPSFPQLFLIQPFTYTYTLTHINY